MAQNECKIDDSNFFEALYSVYKKLSQFILHTYLLTSFEKDTSVLLKVVKIWTS